MYDHIQDFIGDLSQNNKMKKKKAKELEIAETSIITNSNVNGLSA